uniref:RRM domain-containing protein n=1 Tax=Ciona savignyi TaxID=51511 RepID=H2Y908_CIOSA
MNGLTKIRLINDLNEKELRMGVAGTPSSWHYQYRDSAWIYAGSLPYELSEGDVICVFSQYGEIVNINLIRDRKTGKSKGFAFVCYEDQKSTILAVDNLNGTKIKGRQIRVDHVMAYQVPKEEEDIDELTEKIREQGVAPDVMREYEKKEVEIVDEEVVLLSDSEDEKPKKKKHKKEKKKKKAKLSFLKETPTEKAKKSSKTRDNITPPRKQKKEAKSERNNGRGEFNQSPRKTRDLSSDSDSSREKMKTKKAINRRKRRKDSESSVSSLDERNQRDNKRGERERPRDADSHEKKYHNDSYDKHHDTNSNKKHSESVAQEKHHRDADSTEKRHNKTYRDAVAYEKHHKMDSHEKRPRDNSHERNFDSTSRDKRQRDDYRHKTHESRQDKHKSYDRKNRRRERSRS